MADAPKTVPFPQLDRLAPAAGPLVVRHAAFAVAPAIYDELARLLRAREFHHVFDTENGAIYMDQIALTRAPATLTAADIKPSPTFTGYLTGRPVTAGWIIENGRIGADRRYITLEHGLANWTDDVDDAVGFARKQDAEIFSGDAVGWIPVEHVWG